MFCEGHWQPLGQVNKKPQLKISSAMLILRLMDDSQLIELRKFFSNIKVQNKYGEFTQKQGDKTVNYNIGDTLASFRTNSDASDFG